MLKLYVKDFGADSIVITWEGDGSLKHELINDNYVNILVGKIKNRKPDKLIVTSQSLRYTLFNLLGDNQIYLDDFDGLVYLDEVTGYNKIEKEIEASNAFELIVRNEDFAHQLNILMLNNYIVDIKEIGDKTKFVIHGQAQ